MKNHVEFVSYSGRYPNLCSGVLILRIDDEEVSFGGSDDYEQFWDTDGQCYFATDWEPILVLGEWHVECDELPEQYRKYWQEIQDVMNDNIPRGCCGGCL